MYVLIYQCGNIKITVCISKKSHSHAHAHVIGNVTPKSIGGT